MICCIIICPCCSFKTQETHDRNAGRERGKNGRVRSPTSLFDAIYGRHGLSAKHLPLLRDKGAGATLFDLTSASFLKAVRRMLTLLGHTRMQNKCTLKAFRAGRVTSLAAASSPTGVILGAGEWTSSAFLGYCQADEISVSAVLEVVCAEDED